MKRKVLAGIVCVAVCLTFSGCYNGNEPLYQIEPPSDEIQPLSEEVSEENVSEAVLSTEEMSEQETSQINYTGTGYPRHAPNVYVNWNSEDAYDIITVDWCCVEDGENTYYAVHNWDGGYAGFQNAEGEHKLLLSVWDVSDNVVPEIEYVLNGENGDFGGEGTGKHVFTDYDWKVGTWYTMRIEKWEEDGKTFFGQWVREGEQEWLKTAVISIPVTDFYFGSDSMFMEDFTFNNCSRSCKVSNAYGRSVSTGLWVSWDTYSISNTYFPTNPPSWENVQWNVDFDSTWSLDNEGRCVIVTSGGHAFEPRDCVSLPFDFYVDQADTPSDITFTMP